jgi:2'-5' RNA ligase
LGDQRVTGSDGTERWRCFVAVPIPDNLRAVLAAFVESLRRHPDADEWRWTNADAWHITLAFLGPTDSARVPDLVSALTDAVADESPFSLRAGGLGAFPSRESARVLWYGIADPDRRLGGVASRVSSAVGLPIPQTFQPHLTLARTRAERGSDARSLLAADEPPGASVPITELILNRSHLGSGPAQYEALRRVALAASVTA